MQRFPALGLALFAVLGVGHRTSLAEDTANTPRLTLQQHIFDFGTVQAEPEDLQRDVLLTNEGKGPLEIRGIDVSCGCTNAKVEKTSLNSGESTPLSIFLSTASNGQRSSTIRIRTNDPEAPEREIQVKWSVRAPFWITGRERLYFHNVEPGQMVHQDIRFVGIRRGSEKPDFINPHEVEVSAVEKDLLTVKQLDKRVRFTLKVPSNTSITKSTVSIRIPSVSEEITLQKPVEWSYRKSLIVAIPDSRYLGRKTAKGEESLTFRLSSRVQPHHTKLELVDCVLNSKVFDLKDRSFVDRKDGTYSLRLDLAWDVEREPDAKNFSEQIVLTIRSSEKAARGRVKKVESLRSDREHEISLGIFGFFAD